MDNLFHFIEKPRVNFDRQAQIVINGNQAQANKVLSFYLLLIIPLYLLFIFSLFQPQKSETEILKSEICEVNKKSLLCYNPKVFEDLHEIAKSKQIPIRLILGIANAESSLFTNFNKQKCKTYNNPYGLKGKMQDNGKVKWYKSNGKKGDENGCFLFKFESVQEATKALANTVKIGYAKCNNKIDCIAYSYVGNPNIAEQSWIKNVKVFYK